MGNKKTKDLSDFGEIWDQSGDMLFEDNLKKVFIELSECNLLSDTRQKYTFLVSKAYFPARVDPYRGSLLKTGTLRMLLKFWRGTFGEDFSADIIIGLREEQKNYWESFQKQAQRRSAWAVYGTHVRSQEERKEYRRVEKLPEEERERELARLRGRPNNLIIG